jgi:hypothetical protein
MIKTVFTTCKLLIQGYINKNKTHKIEASLMTWERKILRKIYGPAYENVYYRIKVNEEISNLFKSPDIVTVIKVCKLEWFTHIVRMDGERTVKKSLEGKPGQGRKKRGKARLRWMDGVELDVRNMGVKICKTRALDRKEWASAVREVKAKLKRDIVLKKEKDFTLHRTLFPLGVVVAPSVTQRGCLDI